MIYIIKSWLKNNKKSIKPQTTTSNIPEKIEAKLKKYNETYRLLEEYDRKSIKDPAVLADPGRLRDAVSALQRSSGAR